MKLELGRKLAVAKKLQQLAGLRVLEVYLPPKQAVEHSSSAPTTQVSCGTFQLSGRALPTWES